VSYSHRGSTYGVRDLSHHLSDIQIFSKNFRNGTNSTNGLRSRARKWLLAITASMFALSTGEWIFSVVDTFMVVDSWNSNITACYGNNDAASCLVRRLNVVLASSDLWLWLIDNILFVNVSTAQHRAPALYPHITHKHLP
jgi:hypothetical protein